jgi:hypothetical protein
MFIELVEKIKQLYVLPFNIILQQWASIFRCEKVLMTYLPLWLTFFGVNWQPKHVTIGLFQVVNTYDKTLAKNLIELLEKYNLRKKIIAYVKSKGSDINTMITTLKIVVSCEILGLEESY